MKSGLVNERRGASKYFLALPFLHMHLKQIGSDSPTLFTPYLCHTFCADYYRDHGLQSSTTDPEDTSDSGLPANMSLIISHSTKRLLLVSGCGKRCDKQW